MIEFKDLQSDDPNIQGELDMLKELNPIFLRIEELPNDYEMDIDHDHWCDNFHNNCGKCSRNGDMGYE